MKTKNLKLTFKIILLGLITMVASYIPELFPNFFGDWLCEGTGNYLSNLNHFEKCNYAGSSYNFHNPTWHWGYRHYIYLVTCFILLIVQIFDITEN